MSLPRERFQLESNPGQERLQRAQARASSSAPRRSRTRRIIAAVALGLIAAGVWAWTSGVPEPEPIAASVVQPDEQTIGISPATAAPERWYSRYISRAKHTISASSPLAERQSAIAAAVEADAPAAGAEQAAPAGAMRAEPGGAPAAPGPAAASPLAPPDRSALHLADNVLDLRKQRAAHLRWLDACERQRLVPKAKSDVQQARDDAERNAAMIRASNLAADLGTHQAEVRRLTPLRDAAEKRLAKYCGEHGQSEPEIAQPAETASGAVAVRPVAPPRTTRGAPGGRDQNGNAPGFDAFSQSR